MNYTEECISDCREQFARIDGIALRNQKKVLDAFRANRIEPRHFSGTNGYGNPDVGRDTLDRLFADVLGAEDALVRPQIVSGTHALSIALFGLLKSGMRLTEVTGAPYDTLAPVIGKEEAWGSLKQCGVAYEEIDLIGARELTSHQREILAETDVVALQRSSGYGWRRALSVAELGRIIRLVRSVKPDVVVMVDNCYGEFTEETEPTAVGADVIVGSLIKNIGGGIAPTGGYIAGTRACIEKIAYSLTCPGLGREEGSYAGGYREFYQGLFLAPHVVAQAVKGAVLCARVFGKAGYEVLPAYDEARSDIIQAIRLGSEEAMEAFCRAVQSVSPVDSFVVPEAWEMPGYADRVIMAAGGFVQGASIELSADGPIRPPYILYWQGGLTFEHCVLAITEAAEKILKKE